ncbi:PREDICTED: protein CASP-like [Nicotiana attenuata]|uniref:Protein CASP n=1 Tax=Nicotiana attenuata TaxID=49451 RepID=A0A1J6IE24_NICAT|nr:PREDICTED: protein CASP-like [Nicotiana attenuata]OIT02858.1 protein casp [Nicotiana attenuata]
MDSPRVGPEREKGNSTSSSTPLDAVASFWKDFDLEKERSTLDEQGLRIAENQENSQKNRRKLAESTRDFKKASNEDKLSLFNSLLKGYQEEVDNLTKRAKYGENAFLNIYQKLYEAPDPYPVIASIAEKDSKLSELESENRKMKVELEEFRMEATHLKNQQATIRRLEDRCRQLEQQMEEKVKEIVEIKQRSLAEENQKTLEVLKEREQLLQDQLRQAQESVSTMQKLHELAQSQLFEVRAQSEEERATKQSEVNLLMDEVERAQTRLLSLEREKGLLRTQLQTANEDNDHKNSDNLDADSALENSLYAKEKIISDLNVELHKLENTLSNEREEHMNEIKKLNSQLNEKEVALEELKKELHTRPTTKLVDDLRKKVKILQAVGYNTIEAEDWEVATSGQEMSKLESLLLDKNRKVEHELTQLKVQLSERTSLLESAEAKIVELTAKVNEQQKLIQKLEDDILKGYSSKDRKGTRFDDWDLSESGGTEPPENAEQRHVSSDQDQSSMLKVICNQRDRFRARLRETEEEIRQLKEKIGALTSELDKTKADNVKLYEKIRYVQDYNSERVISRGSKKYVEDLESGFSSDVESKYKKMYEEDINPFAAFSKKERDQRYKELGLRDKITLSSGRFLLGNKYARTFVFFYTIGLHILVFTCLYRMSALSYLSHGEESLIGDKNLNLPHAL